MSFEADEPLPNWITERFDARTQLPFGPLEHLPVPVDGQITSASSCEPTNGGPSLWTVIIACDESPRSSRTFFEEYLPLSGYQIVALGNTTDRRWDGHTTKPTYLLVLKRQEFVGTLTIYADLVKNRTSIAASMGRLDHPRLASLSSFEAMRTIDSIRWEFAPWLD